MAHTIQSTPDSGLGLEIKVIKTFEGVPSSLESGRGGFQETSARYRAVEPEQWLQRHPEAGSSWPSWPQASQQVSDVAAARGRQVSDISRVESELTMAVAARFVQSTDLMRKPRQFKQFMLS